MVKYETWVSLVHEEARKQGAQSGFHESQSMVSVAADIWNDRKDEIRSASRHEAENIAAAEIDVQ
jgi:hypothetical protein